jgi:hypothetical protein
MAQRSRGLEPNFLTEWGYEGLENGTILFASATNKELNHRTIY